MKSLKFTKMHGAGNDYIYISMVDDCPTLFGKIAIAMSDRHRGVGADGLVVILGSDVADFKMRMYNSDGSEGEMCGNASMCIGKYVYDKGLTEKKTITLETLSGVKTILLNVDESINPITVDMGELILDPTTIRILSINEIVDAGINSSLREYFITTISMGNPHGVVFVDDLNQIDVEKEGRALEMSAVFPEGANIEFVQVQNRGEVAVRVWERGSGETLSCGTGACATVVAGILLDKCDRQVTIHFKGGDLRVDLDEISNHLFMTGIAVTVFEGEFPYFDYNNYSNN